jgi:hypothetical protein
LNINVNGGAVSMKVNMPCDKPDQVRNTPTNTTVRISHQKTLELFD